MSSVPSFPELTVVWSQRSEREIDAALRRLEGGGNLFLDKDRDRRTGAVFYCVREWDRNRSPHPVHILDWVEADGRPKPLTEGLVREVESRKQFWGRNLVQEIAERNEQRKAESEAQERAERQEVGEYFGRRLRLGSGQNSRRHFPVSGQGKK